jgi:3-hydroxypropanoate dehydrogenase
VNEEFLADRPWTSFLVVNIGKPGPDAWFPRNPRLADDVVMLAR